MSILVLDQHSCPYCGHHVGLKRLALQAWYWAKWNCPECGTLLRFDKRRRWLGGACVGIWVASIIVLDGWIGIPWYVGGLLGALVGIPFFFIERIGYGKRPL